MHPLELGAILDSIRKLDWVPRSLRQKYKQVEKSVWNWKQS